MISTTIDTVKATKLRLVVGRFGEMDRAKWWNTKGMLSSLGEMAISRGFAKSHLFARARAVFAVADSRCDEVFNLPESITLWRLPPELEDQIEDDWAHWLESPDEWTDFLNQVNEKSADNLLDVLSQLELIPDDTVAKAKKLKRADDAKSVPLSAVSEVTDDTIALLAAGFCRSEPGKLSVPYARYEESQV